MFITAARLPSNSLRPRIISSSVALQVLELDFVTTGRCGEQDISQRVLQVQSRELSLVNIQLRLYERQGEEPVVWVLLHHFPDIRFYNRLTIVARPPSPLCIGVIEPAFQCFCVYTFDQSFEQCSVRRHSTEHEFADDLATQMSCQCVIPLLVVAALLQAAPTTDLQDHR